jgi:hypothetical protein
MAETHEIAECVEVCSAGVKSRIPTTEFGLWDLPTFSTVQHLSCLNVQGILARSIHKAWLQQHFSLQVPEPLNTATDAEYSRDIKTPYFTQNICVIKRQRK